MDSSPKDQQEIPNHLEQKKLVEFLESLHRICKIGIYYPAGHKVLDQAAEQFQRNILGVADTNRSVLIELKGEALLVEGYEISTLTNALCEFKKLIHDLGIGTIEIDRTIILPDLIQLVKSLLLGRSQLQGIKEFTQANLDSLPRSVRILQKEFVIDESAILPEGGDEDAERGLNAIFQVLAEQGVDQSQIKQCKDFLNSLAKRCTTKPLKVKGLSAVTWSDVRGLLIKVIANAYHRPEDSGGAFVQNDLSVLSSIFLGLEREIQDKESQETIKMLVSIFGDRSLTKKQPATENDKSKNIRPADKIPVKSVNELQFFVNDNLVDGKILEKITQIDRCEELAILLQLLQFKQETAVEEKIRRNLRDILKTPLNTPEIDTLIMGVMHLETCEDNSRFYNTLHSFTLLLRSSMSISSLQFLLMICQKISPAGQTLLWPILVNEILALGRVVEQKAFGELATIAATLTGPEMKERWLELEALDCFQEKRIADDIFDPELKSTFPLFSYLLDTSIKKPIGVRILKSLATSPPDWLSEAIAPLLQIEVPQHIKFLQIYLLTAQQKYFSINLRVAAGSLVVQHLPEISEQQRREAWVVKTLQATPKMQVEEMRQLLMRIIEEKHMVILPKWPKACRRAAAEAVKNLKRRPL